LGDHRLKIYPFWRFAVLEDPFRAARALACNPEGSQDLPGVLYGFVERLAEGGSSQETKKGKHCGNEER
jgi:hypothetical protein